jgi:AcrR family transcriptional regulator
MARTRGAVLRGARECVLTNGTRHTTMVQIAKVSGVAKATLYNHFRAKEEVFSALVESEVEAAAAEAGELAAVAGAAPALVRAAERLGTHPVVRRLAETEPGTLAALTLPGEQPAPAWQAARNAVAALVPAHSVELALRWLVTQLLWPATREELEMTATALLEPDAPVVVDNGLGFPKVAERIPGVLTEVH